MSLSDDKQADVFDVFNNASRNLDDILNIYNVFGQYGKSNIPFRVQT